MMSLNSGLREVLDWLDGVVKNTDPIPELIALVRHGTYEQLTTYLLTHIPEVRPMDAGFVATAILMERTSLGTPTTVLVRQEASARDIEAIRWLRAMMDDQALPPSFKNHVLPRTSETGRLRFAVLGPVRAWRDDRELDLGTPLQRSILTMLLLREGHAITPNEMIDAIWGEDAPPRALGALRTYVSRLRAVLEPDRSYGSRPELLTSFGRGYMLRLVDSVLDLARFEHNIQQAMAARKAGRSAEAARILRAALSMFEGEPLNGAVGPYIERQRDRLIEHRLNAVEALMDVNLELGNHAKIVSELLALTAQNPLRERLCEQLMLAFYRCGQQVEALAVFTETRRALVNELGIMPGPTLAALHQRILVADPALLPPGMPPRDCLSPSASENTDFRMPRPEQLPAVVRHFTGRQELVHSLNGLLRGPRSAGNVPVVAISGTAGVGKTALAIHVSHECRDAFPDGQLYVYLRGDTDEASKAESALAGFLLALGIPADVIPDGLSERSALYRSLLAKQRILVVLDNARDAQQVMPLLPGARGCAAIITSRSKLTDLFSAHLIGLDVMEPDEALSLFASVVGPERVEAEPTAAMNVVAACGFLPLAIRIMASRLAARPLWTIASLVSRLTDEQRRLDELRVGNMSVDAAFALGYDVLDTVQARAFRLLSLQDGPDISTDAAAAMLALGTRETADLLESLLDASMLISFTPTRYRFHDLLKTYARRLALQVDSEDERVDSLDRLIAFYLTSARSVMALVTARADNIGGYAETFSNIDAAAWLAVEREALFAAITQAGAAANESRRLLPSADLLLTLEQLREPDTYTREFESAARFVLNRAHHLRDTASEVRSRYVLSRVLQEMGWTAEAEEQARIGYELSKGAGELSLLDQFHRSLASAMLGEPE